MEHLTSRPDISTNNRKRGFSLRVALENMGVTTEEAMRKHMEFIRTTEERTGRLLDITRYRVNPNNPNSVPMMG